MGGCGEVGGEVCEELRGLRQQGELRFMKYSGA